VFARYGLADKAVERLRALVRRRPDLVRARERLVELMAESQNPALPQEVEELAGIYRRSGRDADAEALRRRHPGAIAPPPPAARAEAAFDEFGIDAPAARRAAGGVTAPLPAIAPADEFGDESLRVPAPELARPAAPRVTTPSDSEFVSYEELGTLLEDEMHKAEEAPAPPAAETPVVDEQSLFADERQFFNLAEELEKELADEPAAAEAAVEAGPQGEASLEEIFREFKKGVEQQLSAEDYETHFNLGIAYKEMGLTDEAIGEFQLASKDPARMVECCSMLGLCFLEKGMPQLAIKWYRKGLEAPDIKEVETVGLLYDLACVYQDTGETDLAYRTFLEVYGLNTNYRDIVSRVKDLEAVKKN
jgi:tetratricopeptide (TPR) repeat protein